ncbi:MAG: putative Peptidoglycan glycosyltransferase [Candidatus Saccharibacteria bacterium]|nr:putative Peptidoglycan glycosyltransferase [Candidatus Saccharibacteria bacterium]
MPRGIMSGNRTRLLAVVCVGIMAIFIVRLFYLQVIDHETYVSLANQEQLKRLVIPAARGEIYAMDAETPVKLVLNETVYTVFVDPQVVTKPKEVIETIRSVAGGNARDDLEKLVGKKDSRYQIVATKVTRKQAELTKKHKLAGLGFQATSQRVYPEAQLAAQTLGFVNAEDKGQYGVEGYLNDRLTGEDGVLQSVTDVSNVPLTIGRHNINQPAKNGDNIVLTIDRNIQSYTEKALADGLARTGATNGSAIIMDPQTGKILAMANLPTYQPAEFTKVTDAEAFNNGVVTRPYEAGSVFKTFTVSTGLDTGVIQPNSTYVNTDSIKVEDRVISNAARGHTGTITIQDALNYSLNTGMVTIAQRLGDGSQITKGARDTIYRYYHDKFGLGELTGVEVSGESAGRVISPEEEGGNAVQYATMVFGQGLDVTMVQVAAGFSAMVNGGTYYSPTVIGGVMDSNGTLKPAPIKPAREGIITQDTSTKLRQMTHEARQLFPPGDRPGYYIGGKTGTSQTLDANGKYRFDQTIGTYLGFGGSEESSKYVIMVQVSGKNMNLEGNIHAKPIFTDISNWMLDYMKLQPKG